MTSAQREWRKKWQETYNGLPRHKSPGWRFNEAHRLMRKHHGHEPPGLFGVLLKTLFGWMKAGGTGMSWDWTKTLWKSIRAALGMAVGLAVLSFLGGFDSEAELAVAGVPKWLAPLGAMGVAAIIAFARNWIAINRPQWNVVKKAGDKVVRPVLKA